jgi:hypothetical protein
LFVGVLVWIVNGLNCKLATYIILSTLDNLCLAFPVLFILQATKTEKQLRQALKVANGRLDKTRQVTQGHLQDLIAKLDTDTLPVHVDI